MPSRTQWIPNRYPQARRSDHVDVYKSETKGEVRVHDPYQWLEHNTEETERWVTAQEGFTRQYLDQNAENQSLEDEIRNNEKFAKGSDFFTIYVRPTSAPLVASPDGTRPSHDEGRLPEEIRYVKFSGITWSPDSKGFFYQRFPTRESHGSADQDLAGTETDSDKNATLYYHRLGTDQAEDVLVHKDEAHPEWMWGTEITELDKRYLLLTITRDTAPALLFFEASFDLGIDGGRKLGPVSARPLDPRLWRPLGELFDGGSDAQLRLLVADGAQGLAIGELFENKRGNKSCAHSSTKSSAASAVGGASRTTSSEARRRLTSEGVDAGVAERADIVESSEYVGKDGEVAMKERWDGENKAKSTLLITPFRPAFSAGHVAFETDAGCQAASIRSRPSRFSHHVEDRGQSKFQ
ncbi:predicted protein [Postia placenta Mad-698-R]|nr:predicted protein [Postia placenta Mad-698-R]